MLQNQNTVDTAAARARSTDTTHGTHEGSRGDGQPRARRPHAAPTSDAFSLSEGQVRLSVVPATSHCRPYLMHLPPGELPKCYSKSAKIQTKFKNHIHTYSEQPLIKIRWERPSWALSASSRPRQPPADANGRSPTAPRGNSKRTSLE